MSGQAFVGNMLRCISSDNTLITGIVVGLVLITLPSGIYFRWTPWLPPFLKKLITNSTFQISYIIVSILLSCAGNPRISMVMFILHIAIFSKFAGMNIPDQSEEGFANGLWKN